MFQDLIVAELDLLESPSNNFFYESGVYDLTDLVKGIFEKVIAKMTEFAVKLKSDIMILKSKQTQKQQFKTLKKLLEKSGTNKTKVNFPNVGKAISLYEKGIKSFEKDLNAILKKTYNSYSLKDERNIDTKIRQFEEDLNDFEEEVNDALHETIALSGKDALRYVEDVLSGKCNVYDYYYDLIHQFEQFKAAAERELRVKQINSTTNIQRHKKSETLLTKLAHKVSSLLRKIVTCIAFWTV